MMNKKEILQGEFHDLTKEIENILLSNEELLKKWNLLTPLARNEWICWTTIPKKEETRKEHIKRLEEDILKGKRRPCCWQGCPHRNKNGN